MGSPAVVSPKSETFREARERAAFETIRTHFKNMLNLRLDSSDPTTRKAAHRWQEIIKEAEAK